MIDISHISMIDLAGVDLRRHRNGEHHGQCPFCGGTDRFWVREHDQRWFCRQCSPQGGNAITFVMKSQNLSFPEALDYLRIDRNTTAIARPKPEPKPLVVPEHTPLFWDVEWEHQLEKHPRLVDWLEGRGVNWFGRIHGRLGFTGKDSRLPGYCQNKLAIPWFDDAGQVMAVKVRSLPGEPKAYRSFENSHYEGLYGNLFASPFYVILETELDRLALSWQLGYSNCVASCPLSGFSAVCAAQIPREARVVYVAIDRGGEKLYHDVKARLPQLQVVCLTCKRHKDFGECMQAGVLPHWVDHLRQGYHALAGRSVGIGEIVR